VSSSEGKTLLTSHYDESGSVAATTRWSYVSDVLRDVKTFRGTTGPHFGVLHGTSTVYHSSGKIERQTEYRDGKKHGPDVEYHSNGQIRFEATYFAGKLHGPWTRYWENGALDSRGHYKAGKKHGTFDYYLSDGSLRDRDVYEEGRCSRECEGTE
ncbi:MAG: hypothetical protein QF768_01095, partial [Candidatus Latescibacteria bacterium]|nr:hypothetical protein [Candidatus Latescibacterota bacterium]